MSNFKPYQYKTAGTLSVKDIDAAGRTVMGYFSSTGTLDSDGDVFAPRAFEKSLKEHKDRIMHLLQHDPQRPIGRPSVLKEDDKGLYFETPIAKTDLGDDTLQLYKDGVYNEHSVGFQMLKSEPDQDGSYDTVPDRWTEGKQKPANIIKEAKLWEGSTVTWGANQNTPFIGVKGLEYAFKRKGILEKALHRGNMRDDTYYKLQIELQQLLTAIETNIAQPPAQTETKRATAAAKEENKSDELDQLAKKLSTVKF